MATNHLKRNHYDNAVMLAPSGRLMTTISLDKVEWYLSRGIADEVEVPGYSRAIKLHFEPKRNNNDAADLVTMPNRCVVCGREDTLSLHHVVPYHVKRHYPLAEKSHTRRQCLLLCETDHLAIEAANRALIEDPYAPLAGHLNWLNFALGRYTQFLKRWAVRYWRWRKGGVKAINRGYIDLFMTHMKPQYLPKDWLQP